MTALDDLVAGVRRAIRGEATLSEVARLLAEYDKVPKKINQADEFRAWVLRRTGLAPDELKCPREKSAMTPCIARDGQLAVGVIGVDEEICIGCERRVAGLFDEEREKHGPAP